MGIHIRNNNGQRYIVSYTEQSVIAIPTNLCVLFYDITTEKLHIRYQDRDVIVLHQSIEEFTAFVELVCPDTGD